MRIRNRLVAYIIRMHLFKKGVEMFTGFSRDQKENEILSLLIYSRVSWIYCVLFFEGHAISKFCR